MNGEFDKDFIDQVNTLEDQLNQQDLIKLREQHEDPACIAYIDDAIEWVKTLTNDAMANDKRLK